MLELRPVRTAAERYDVGILGGGLAGLTLAIQLKRQRPQTSVLVLEKREGPAPQAAFKVGESTVPSGAHYFAEIVGMEDHLQERQLKKCGLRFILPSGDNSDITQRVELGQPNYPPHDNFQLDRGLFENELAARARALGADLLQGCRVGEVTIGEDLHVISYTQLESDTSTRARWVVDASGRASLLKRKLGLSRQVGHTINSAWFRLGGGLDLEQWGASDEAWMGRMAAPGLRQYSTNHLLGEGYWVWLIRLSTGPISIGVCADPRYHPFEEIGEFDRLLDWLRRHEPQLAASVEPRMGQIEDFLRVEDFAFGVDRVLSPDRWCLVGEAGAFADPFYSPGSDFIGYGNLFAGDVIARDLDGEDIRARLGYFNDFYQRTFQHVLARTEDQYPLFGNPWVAAGKLTWDAYHNHSGVVLLMLKNKLTDLEFMQSVDDDIEQIYQLNIRMQQFFRQWHERERRSLPGLFPPPFPALIEGFVGLTREQSDDELRASMRRNVQVGEAMAVALFHKAASALLEPPGLERAINPRAISLEPERWEADGLFEGPGLTLAQATEVVRGIYALWPDGGPA